jgi:hypothetical protein
VGDTEASITYINTAPKKKTLPQRTKGENGANPALHCITQHKKKINKVRATAPKNINAAPHRFKT